MFKEVPLNADLISELDKIVDKLKYDLSVCDDRDFDPTITTQHCQNRTSEKALNQVLEGYDRNVATADENVLRMPPEFVKSTPLPKMFEDLMVDVCQADGHERLFHVTGKFWYPNNGYMGWHTNNTYPGFRFYCTHAEEADKSFFRYRDPDTKEIVTSWDRAGWMGRLFKIDKDRPFWHCVYSETNRISTGCNLEIDTTYSLDWERLGGTT